MNNEEMFKICRQIGKIRLTTLILTGVDIYDEPK